MQKNINNNKIYYLKILILVSFVLFYLFMIKFYFLKLPGPSDALQYLTPSAFGTSWGWWMWFDRLTLGIGLGFFTIFFNKIYIGGIVYIVFVSTLLLSFSIYISYKLGGFISAVFCAVFLITSNYFLIYSSSIYPNQTLALYSLISFYMFYFYNSTNNRFFDNVFLAGFFSAFALFSKVTGIVVIILLLFDLIVLKRIKDIKKFILGLIIGTLFIFLLYILVYNYQSLYHAAFRFFKSSIHANLTSRGNNAVSYLPVLLDTKFFPVFISLFILIGVYRDKVVKKFYQFGWGYVGIIFFIYTFSYRGGNPIPLYIYTSFIFFSIGLSLYLSKLIRNNDFDNQLKQKFGISFNFDIVYYFAVIVLMIMGFVIGINYPTFINKLYSSSNVSILIKWMPILLPVFIVIALSYIEFSKSQYIVILLILVISFWSSLTNSAIAYYSAITNKKHLSFFYKNAPLFNEVSEMKFSVYISDWNKISKSERIIWLYWVFFNKKYPISNDYDALAKTRKNVESSIKYIKTENELKKLEHKYLLTNELSTIKKYYSEYLIINRISWYNNIYYLIKII